MFTASLRRMGAVLVTLAMVGCSSPTNEAGADPSATEQELRSGHTACPGYGWTDRIVDWTGVKGSYKKRGAATAGEVNKLVVLEEPSSQNDGKPKYDRELDATSDTGTLVLGVDNPAIGPVLGFDDSALGAKDLYWVLGQKRNKKKELVGLCLAQASTVEGVNAQRPAAFMLERAP